MYKLLIVDYNMPRLDGPNTSKQVREIIKKHNKQAKATSGSLTNA